MRAAANPSSRSTATASPWSSAGLRGRRHLFAPEIERVYYPEVERLLHGKLGASRIACIRPQRTQRHARRASLYHRGRCTTTTPSSSAPRRVLDVLSASRRKSSWSTASASSTCGARSAGRCRSSPLALARRAQFHRRRFDLKRPSLRPCARRDLAGHWQPRAPLVLAIGYAARRGAVHPGARQRQRRPCSPVVPQLFREPARPPGAPPRKASRVHAGVLHPSCLDAVR